MGFGFAGLVIDVLTGIYNAKTKPPAENIKAQLQEVADTGYVTALDMCANEGQLSLMENIGFDGFWMATKNCYDNETSLPDELLLRTNHPEAIGATLEEVGTEMEAQVEEIRQEAMVQEIAQQMAQSAVQGGGGGPGPIFGRR